jgi:signal transduction histidine kinase
MRVPSSGLTFEFTLDRSWRFTSVSDSMVRWAGRAAEDLVGLDPRRVWAGVPKEVAEAVEAAFAGTASASLQMRSMTLPGLWTRFEIEPAAEGARVRYKDITAQVAAERTIQGADDPADFGLGLGPAEVALLDPRGVILQVNGAWRTAFATHRSDIANAGVGMAYLDLIQATASARHELVARLQIDALLAGWVPRAEAIYRFETVRGPEVRHALVAPLQHGAESFFVAVHDDLAGRARVLAALDEASDRRRVAAEQDRKRAAVEQHENLTRRLATMVRNLDDLRTRVGEDSDARSILDDMTKLTHQAVQETRVSSYLLNGSRDEPEGLVATIRGLVRSFAVRADIEASVSVTGPVDPVSADIHYAIFRVVEEALANIYRHCDARNVTVSLRRRPEGLTLRVSGEGRDAGRPPAVGTIPLFGAGIAGMRARIEQLGGALDVWADAAGSVMVATIPCRGAMAGRAG